MGGLLLTEKQLREKLKFWQQKLRLQDWVIDITIARGRDMPSGTAASVNWTLSKKMAFIKILDPVDYPPDLMSDQNMEIDLIHELIHLHLAPISEHFGDDSNTYHTFEEQAIESIASALIHT